MEENKPNNDLGNRDDQEKPSRDAESLRNGETKSRGRYVVFDIIIIIVLFYVVWVILFNIIKIPYEYKLWKTIIGYFILYSWLLFPPIIFFIYKFKKQINWITFVVGNFVWLIFLLYAIPCFLGARRSDWEGRCELTLKALAATEHEYKHKNEYRNFGTWHELQKTQPPLIESGYSRANIIDNYSLVVFDVKPSSLNANGESNDDSTFIIVAIPRSTRNKLVTFAIGEDQTPKIWRGNPSEWEIEKYLICDKSIWKPLR